MRITAIEAIPVAVPRNPRVYIHGSSGVNRVDEFVVVRLRTEDLEGVGECSVEPKWSGEDWASAKRCIDKYLAPAVLGADPLEIEDVVSRMDTAIPNNPYAKSGIEMALWDIAGKAKGRPLYELLGGKMRERVAVKFVAAQEDPLATAKLAAEAVSNGFHTIKVKTGFGEEADVAKIKAVRAAVGDDAKIGVDANGHWGHQEAISTIRRLEEHGLLFVEQPVSRDRPEWMADVRTNVETPIVAHESVLTVQDAKNAIRDGIADVWAITPGIHGGLTPSRRILALAEHQATWCLIGSTIELGIATAALTHLGVSSRMLDGERFPSDVIGPLYHPEDIVVDQVRVERGYAYPPEGPGLGVTIDERQLARFRMC